MVKFFVDVAWRCGRLARLVQKCCAWACALVRFSARNMSQHVAACCNRVAKRTQHVALNNVAICCARLVGACKCWANSVGLCCIDVLLSFDRALSWDIQVFRLFLKDLFSAQYYFCYILMIFISVPSYLISACLQMMPTCFTNTKIFQSLRLLLMLN